MSLSISAGDVWNTALVTASETLPVYSNNNRTATSNGVSYVQNLTPKANGRWYAELTVGFDFPSDSYRVGLIGNQSSISADYAASFLGENGYSLGWSALGNVMTGDHNVGNTPPYNSEDIVCLAIDLTADLLWLRINDGPWSDLQNSPNSVAYPALGIGGADISTIAISDLVYIGVMLGNSGTNSATIGTLTYSPPTGFIPWINIPNIYSTSSLAVLPLPSVETVMFTGTYTLFGNAQLPLPSSNGDNGTLMPVDVGTANTVGNFVGFDSTIFAFDPYNVSFPYNQCGAQARVNIFDIPRVVHLVLPESCVSDPVLMNYPINRTDFRLIRGVPNVIQFFVRDVDRHIAAGPLANATLTINIVDTTAQKILLERDLFVVNAATCLYGLSTQPIDMTDWPTGYLCYSITVTRQDGIQDMLWTDRDYSPYGFLTMTDGPLPGPAIPTVLDPTTFVADAGHSYSTAVPGAAAKGYPNGMQTFSFYTTNFTGNVVIEASLVDQPSTELQNWFPVTYENFSQANGVTQVSLNGNYLWLRVAIPNRNPIPYPGGIQMITNGQVDRILYLN